MKIRFVRENHNIWSLEPDSRIATDISILIRNNKDKKDLMLFLGLKLEFRVLFCLIIFIGYED